MSYTVNRVYITPITAAGVEQEADSEATFENGRGVYTLANGTTYYFMLPIGSSTMFDIHLTHDAGIIITSATLETSSHGKKDVADNSSVAGEWIDQNPAGAFVGLVGAGTSQAAGVVAVAGGSAGGADWQVSECPAARARLTVVVAGTGGEVRVSFCGKE